jgi:hypothetical protein
MEKQRAHNSHATAAENGANHGFIGVRQSVICYRGGKPPVSDCPRVRQTRPDVLAAKIGSGSRRPRGRFKLASFPQDRRDSPGSGRALSTETAVAEPETRAKPAKQARCAKKKQGARKAVGTGRARGAASGVKFPKDSILSCKFRCGDWNKRAMRPCPPVRTGPHFLIPSRLTAD